MIVRDIKDAEKQIQLLEGRIAQLEKLVILGNTNTVTKEIIKQETKVIEAPDNELNVDENSITHRLIHSFIQTLDLKAGLLTPIIRIRNIDNTVGWLFLQTPLSTGPDLILIDEDGNSYIGFIHGTAPSTMVIFTHIIPSVDNQVEFGSTSNRVKKIWAYDLALTNDLAITEGGTGASSAGSARTNLDVYSKAEVDAAIAAALVNYYTQAQVNTLLGGKANTGVYSVTVGSTSITVPSTPNTQSHGHTGSTVTI